MASTSSSKAASFPGAARERLALAEVLRGMIRDLLERGEQLEHQPATRDALRAADLGERLAHHRLVERDLLGSEGDDEVGLGLARQFRRDCRIRLAPAQQERTDESSEVFGRDRVTRPFDGHRDRAAKRLERPEQAGGGPVEDRPQVAEAVLDRRPRERDPRRAGIARSSRAVRASGFFTCCASSATTRPHSTLTSSARSRRTTP